MSNIKNTLEVNLYTIEGEEKKLCRKTLELDRILEDYQLPENVVSIHLVSRTDEAVQALVDRIQIFIGSKEKITPSDLNVETEEGFKTEMRDRYLPSTLDVDCNDPTVCKINKGFRDRSGRFYEGFHIHKSDGVVSNVNKLNEVLTLIRAEYLVENDGAKVISKVRNQVA